MDGMNALTNLTILAATNLPDSIDKAIVKPSFLGEIIYVRLSAENTRAEIFRIKLPKIPVTDDVYQFCNFAI